jgi:thioester reductase-like protein
MTTNQPPLTLVTGLPQYSMRRLVMELIQNEPEGRFAFLVPEPSLAKMARFVTTLPGPQERYQLLEGDVRQIDLGLSGEEFNRLAQQVEVIHHGAAVFHLGVEREVADEVNVRGVEEIIEFARQAQKLRQLVYYSTVSVSGDHKGVWTEKDYDRGQKFNNHYEATKFWAEGLLRREPALPLTVLRTPVIVGDSETGEIDRYDGPYQLMLLFVALPVDLGLPLPGRASRFINLIPVDFFAQAACALTRHPDALGRTFHLVDPAPLTMAQVFELVAMASEKKVPSGYIPARLTRALMRTPGLERFVDSPVATLDLFTADVVYGSAATQELLREKNISCPRFPSYVENLVKYLREKIAREHAQQGEEQIYDPLW